MILDEIEKSGGNVSVLVLEEIWNVSIPNLFVIKNFELYQKGEGLQYIVKKA